MISEKTLEQLKKEAAKAYNKAAKKYFGEYAKLNIINNNYEGKIR